MSLIKSGFIIAFGTLISRIFGMLRDIALASFFGAGMQADCLNVALKLPNLFRRIFGEGALMAVFVPMYNQKTTSSLEEGKHFSFQIFCLLLFVLGALTVLMQVFMPYAMFVFAPGFYASKEKFEFTIFLCRITMPYILFISLVALFGSILNSFKKFAAFAFMPVFLNLAIIIACVIDAKVDKKAVIISFGIIAGGILQLLFMYLCTRKHNLVPRAKNSQLNSIVLYKTVFNESTKIFIKQMIPASLSAGATQLNLFISLSLASFVAGGVSILSYAERVYQLPLSLIGIAFATVLLPELSKLYNVGNKKQAREMENNSIKIGLYFSFPCALGIIILSTNIINILFERGAFNHQDTILTAKCLNCFCFGLPAFVLNKILTPIFYANHNTQIPMRITIYSLIVNVMLNVIFMYYYGILGISLGSSIASWFNTFLLLYYARKLYAFYFEKDTFVFLSKVIISNAIMYLILKIYIQTLENINLFHVLSVIILGVVVYLLSSLMFRILPIKEVMKIFH